MLQEALAMVQAIKNEGFKIEALAGLLPYLSDISRCGVLEQLLASEFIRFPSKSLRFPVLLARLIPYLPEPEPLLQQAVKIAFPGGVMDLLSPFTTEISGIAELIPHLPEPLLREILKVTLAKPLRHGRTLEALIPHLPEALLQEAIEAMLPVALDRSNKGLGMHIGMLIVTPLALRLAEIGHLEKAIEVLQTIGLEKVELLLKLAPHLPEPLLQEALIAAQASEDRKLRLDTLIELAPYLPKLQKGNVLREVLALARKTGDELYQVLVLAKLTNYLPEGTKDEPLREALAMVQSNRDTTLQATGLVVLAPQLPQQQLQEAFMAALRIGEKNSRAKALTGLVPYLPESQRNDVLQEALITIRAIQDTTDQAIALSNLVPHLPEPMKTEVAVEVLAVVRDVEIIKRDFWISGVLSQLAPHLSEPLLQEALDIALEMPKENSSSLLGKLINFPKRLLSGTLNRLINLFMGEGATLVHLLSSLSSGNFEPISQQQILIQALPPLVPYLTEKMLRQSLVVIQKFNNPSYFMLFERNIAKLLCEIGIRLAELGHPEEALAVVKTIRDDEMRAVAFAELTLNLPALLIEEVLASVRQIGDGYWRAIELLTNASPHLLTQEQALKELVKAAQAMADGNIGKIKALKRLACRLAELGYPNEALAMVQAEQNDKSYQLEILAGIGPYLPEPLLEKALVEAMMTDDSREAQPLVSRDWNRMEALASLANSLEQHSTVNLYQLWRKMLHTLVLDTRKCLLVDLYMLTPIIAVLGGTEAVMETVQAIRDVGRQWP
jgi:hypothetical protein